MVLFGVIFVRTHRRLSRDLVDALAAATQVASECIGKMFLDKLLLRLR
jgi:hypothetical protein